MSCIFLCVLYPCLCVFNLLSCPSGFSLNKILNPFLLLFIAYEVHHSLFVRRKLHFGSPVAHCPKGTDSCCHQAALHSLDDFIALNAVSICRICQPELAKGAVSEH
jgi:hypothetical protein